MNRLMIPALLLSAAAVTGCSQMNGLWGGHKTASAADESGFAREAASDGMTEVRLGRLAVAVTDKGRGLGKWLLMDAMARSLASEVAWAAFVVDAKDESARSFYLQYGFLALADDPLHLFLPRATVEGAFGADRG